jgi:hypothetical protein
VWLERLGAQSRSVASAECGVCGLVSCGIQIVTIFRVSMVLGILSRSSLVQSSESWFTGRDAGCHLQCSGTTYLSWVEGDLEISPGPLGRWPGCVGNRGDLIQLPHTMVRHTPVGWQGPTTDRVVTRVLQSGSPIALRTGSLFL